MPVLYSIYFQLGFIFSISEKEKKSRGECSDEGAIKLLPFLLFKGYYKGRPISWECRNKMEEG
jgi:hypothetical protein